MNAAWCAPTAAPRPGEPGSMGSRWAGGLLDDYIWLSPGGRWASKMDDLVTVGRGTRLKIVLTLVAVTVVMALAGYASGSYGVVVAYQALLLLAAVLGYNLFSGATGYISFGHGMLYGVGGYAAIALTWLLYPAVGHIAAYIAALLAGVIASLLALVSFGPLMRVKGAYFSISSLALFFAAAALVSSIPGLGGSEGLNAPSGGSLSPLEALAVAAVIASLVPILYYALASSRFGRIVLAIRDNEEAAQSLGFNPVPYRLAMLAISGFIVGLAGGIYFLSYGTGYVDPTLAFDPRTNLLLVLSSLAGGLGSLTGVYAMGLAFYLIDSAIVANMDTLAQLLHVSGVRVRAIPFLLYGGLVAAVALTAPRGLYGLVEEHLPAVRRLVRLLGIRAEATSKPTGGAQRGGG